MCKTKVYPWQVFYFTGLMVVVGRPGYRIDCRTIKGGSQVSSLIVSFVESSNHCILASSLLVLVWFFSLWDLELLVILLTSSSSSKTEFAYIFYDVFDVGGYAGSSLLEVSLLSCKAYLLCLFLLTSLCFDATRCLVSNKLEFSQFGAHLRKLWRFWFYCYPRCLLCKMKDW